MLDTNCASSRHRLPAILVFLSLLISVSVSAANAAIIADGIYSVIAPEKTSVGFRLILTAEGARLTPERGETLVFSYAQKSALILDRASKTYVLLPLELVPPLLADGFGYDTRGLGATAPGRKKTLLGLSCAEVLIQGSTPILTMSTWRVDQPSWNKEYALLERSLGLPWTVADPPAVFLGIPLAGSVEVQGRQPYKASWVVTKLSRDQATSEDFTIPDGFRMDMERMISLQGGKKR